jgi:hypothetical protein
VKIEHLPQPVVVDKVVAFVGSRPITLSEVELELRLERAAAGDLSGASGLVTLEQLADLLPVLMERTVVLRGMRAQYPDTLEPGVVEAELEQVRAQFPSPDAWNAFLTRLELSEDEVRERRRRVLEAASILAAAVNDARSVKREDVEKHLAANPGMSREEAEKELLAANEPVVRAELLEKKKMDVQASIVDSIVPGRGREGAAE